MRVLHAYNLHRGGGGSDNDWLRTIAASRAHGLDIAEFARNSRELPPGLAGRARAFFSGVYAREAVADFDRTLREFKPDVVHAHELFPLVSPWILPRCTRARVPVVFTCYDFRLTCPVATHFAKGALCTRCQGGREYWAVLRNCRAHPAESVAFALRSAVARMFRLVTGHVSQYIVLTDFSRAWLRDSVGVPDARIATNPCCIDLPETAADPAAGRYVGYAGRFVPEKGVELLLEAARRAKLPVVLAGDAPTHPAIRPGDQAECILTGSRADLETFYRSARMLAVPSIWYETFGIVAAEAMSHGVPVVGTRLGALCHTIDDGVTGLLFDKGDADDLAQKLLRLWDDAGLCRTMGAAARRRIAEHHGSGVFMERLTKIYEQAIEHPVFAA